ncbi:MAG: hypothetical protein ABID38_05085 [Candidatus Diapherotrites archaeon]
MSVRNKRLRHFDQRAVAFDKAIQRGEGFKEVELVGRRFRVGTGQHKRLIAGKKVGDLKEIAEREKRLLQAINKSEITPNGWELVPVASTPGHRINLKGHNIFLENAGFQEFFHKPTLAQLFRFFEPTTIPLPKEEKILAKRFIKENKSIALKELKNIYEDFCENYLTIYHFPEKASNIIVLVVSDFN